MTHTTLFRAVLRLSLLLLVVIVGVVTAMYSYFEHRRSEELFDRMEKVVTQPDARPDAWTKTQDDSRTQELCLAIKLLFLSVDTNERWSEVLPKVCVHSEGTVHADRQSE